MCTKDTYPHTCTHIIWYTQTKCTHKRTNSPIQSRHTTTRDGSAKTVKGGSANIFWHYPWTIMVDLSTETQCSLLRLQNVWISILGLNVLGNEQADSESQFSYMHTSYTQTHILSLSLTLSQRMYTHTRTARQRKTSVDLCLSTCMSTTGREEGINSPVQHVLYTHTDCFLQF